MSEESPAGTLRRAAAMVRGLARSTTPGPWWNESGTVKAPHWNGVPTAACHPLDAQGGNGVNAGMDGEWAAMLGPQIAEPLAAWLEQVAASAETHVPIWRRKRPDGWDGEFGDPWIDRDPAEHAALVRGHYGHALDVAKALLGEVPAQPDPDGAT